MTDRDTQNTEEGDVPQTRNDYAGEGGAGDDPTGPTTDSGPTRDAPRSQPVDTESDGDTRTRTTTTTETETPPDEGEVDEGRESTGGEG